MLHCLMRNSMSHLLQPCVLADVPPVGRRRCRHRWGRRTSRLADRRHAGGRHLQAWTGKHSKVNVIVLPGIMVKRCTFCGL